MKASASSSVGAFAMTMMSVLICGNASRSSAARIWNGSDGSSMALVSVFTLRLVAA